VKRLGLPQRFRDRPGVGGIAPLTLHLDDQRLLLRQMNFAVGDVAFGHSQVSQHRFPVHNPT